MHAYMHNIYIYIYIYTQRHHLPGEHRDDAAAGAEISVGGQEGGVYICVYVCMY